MLTSRELLDTARERRGFPTNAALSRFLGVPERTLQRWKMRKHTPDDDMAARLAELAGMDQGVVLAAMAAQRATDDAARARWEQVADRLSRSVAAGLAVLAVSAGVPSPSQAGTVVPVEEPTTASLCIMSSRRTVAAAARLLAWLALPPLPAWVRPAAHDFAPC
jgi:hypothetical protein